MRLSGARQSDVIHPGSVLTVAVGAKFQNPVIIAKKNISNFIEVKSNLNQNKFLASRKLA